MKYKIIGVVVLVIGAILFSRNYTYELPPVSYGGSGTGPVREEEVCPRETEDLFASLGLKTSVSDNDETLTKGGAVPDGRFGFGFVRKVSKNQSGEVLLTVDPALWFSDGYEDGSVQNADLAAKEDRPSEYADAPNGFYIRNEKHITRDYVLPATAQVFISTSYTPEPSGQPVCGGNYGLKVSAETYFARADKQLKEAPNALLPISYNLQDGSISVLGEQYVP